MTPEQGFLEDFVFRGGELVLFGGGSGKCKCSVLLLKKNCLFFGGVAKFWGGESLPPPIKQHPGNPAEAPMESEKKLSRWWLFTTQICQLHQSFFLEHKTNLHLQKYNSQVDIVTQLNKVTLSTLKIPFFSYYFAAHLWVTSHEIFM